MPRQLQNRVLDLIEMAWGVTLEREACPSWLLRPGRNECGDAWAQVSACYTGLTGLALPDEMPARERRSLDAVVVHPDGTRRIIEVGEVQHFTPQRARTFDYYPPGLRVAFDWSKWAHSGAAATKLRGGGWGKPKPPLFPDEGGRHVQRAFRDMLADVLPAGRAWAPTLRVADFELESWLARPDAVTHMLLLLQAKLEQATVVTSPPAQA